jgi:arginine decarboxylase
LLFVPTFEDALLAVLLNSEIQACVIRPGFGVVSHHRLDDLRRFIEDFDPQVVQPLPSAERMLLLRKQIAERRPEIDLYLSILRGVAARYEMPFFTALTSYSRQPTGVFHGLPISRGKSGSTRPGSAR